MAKLNSAEQWIYTTCVSAEEKVLERLEADKAAAQEQLEGIWAAFVATYNADHVGFTIHPGEFTVSAEFDLQRVE